MGRKGKQNTFGNIVLPGYMRYLYNTCINDDLGKIIFQYSTPKRFYICCLVSGGLLTNIPLEVGLHMIPYISGLLWCFSAINCDYGHFYCHINHSALQTRPPFPLYYDILYKAYGSWGSYSPKQ